MYKLNPFECQYVLKKSQLVRSNVLQNFKNGQ